MVLDRVHHKAIQEMVGHIEGGIDFDQQPRRAAREFKRLERVEEEGQTIIESIGRPRRYYAGIESLALAEDPYSRTMALDGGSAGVLSFPSGLHVELAQAALASTPSDLDLHRRRSVVGAAYAPTGYFKDIPWSEIDEGYGRMRLVRMRPNSLQNHIDTLVHYVGLYSAEAGHLNWQLDQVEEFLFVDGPLHPKSLMYWRLVGEEPYLDENPIVEEILNQYVENYRTLIQRGVPPVGFIKSTHGRQIVKALGDTPWTKDSQFLKQLLGPASDEVITHTNWFIQVAQYYRNKLGGTHPDSLENPGLSGLTPCFSYVYLPPKDQLYRVECPHALIKKEETRERITMKVLHEVAKAGGIPHPIQKADQIARMSIEDRRGVRGAFGVEPDLTYDDERWGDLEWI